MNVVIPTTNEVTNNIVAQIEAALSQTIPLLPKAFTRVLAKALAGFFILIYKYAGFGILQLFVAYATMRETEVNGTLIKPLVEWGRMVGVGDPIDATRAEHGIQITVLNQTGTLTGGSQLLRPQTGVLYQTIAPVTLDAPTKQVTVRAVSDQQGGGGAGTIGNLVNGDVLEFATPPPNVATEAVVVSTEVVGADAETPDAYRARVLRRFQRKPQGGAYADYQTWAEGVPGVANAYPYTGMPGEVDVYVEATATALNPDGIPDQALLDAVDAAIQMDVNGLASNRPANAAVNPLPITRTEFEVRVGGLDAPDMSSAQAAINEGMDEFLRSLEPFIVGLSVLPRQDRVTQGAVAGVVHEIVSAEGGTVSFVDLLVGGIEQPAYTLLPGEKAKLDEDGVEFV